MGPRGGPPFAGSEPNSPALRGQVGELGEHAALGAPAVAAEAAGDQSLAAAAETGGNALFDLLATAAEDTLRREELVKTSDPPTSGDSADPSNEVEAAVAPAKNNGKRKRKGANEPKNPLGAFVCK